MPIEITMPEVSLTVSVDNFRKYYDKLHDKGVYFLWSRDGTLLYVGQSVNLYTRIGQHLAGRDHSDRFCDDIAVIEIYFVRDDFQREVYETYAINEYRPVYNASKVYNKTRTNKDVEIDDKISELRSERFELASEVVRIQQHFGGAVIYDEEDLEYDELHDWGVMLRNRERIEEIDKKVRELNSQRRIVDKSTV